MLGQLQIAINGFSIMSLLSQKEFLAGLRESVPRADSKHVLERILETAAAVDTVLKYKGPYSSR